jgi:hypothetical protein
VAKIGRQGEGGGRPLKFATVPELQKKIDEYFKHRAEMHLPFTVSGLALFLDTTRETLMDYQHRDKFADAIKRAKLRCADYAETEMYLGKNAAGPIFALKNFAWRDKQEVDHTTGGQPFVLPGEIINKNNLSGPHPGSK